MSLPETTTDRLLAVADIIDLTPERWDQAYWFLIDDDEPNLRELIGQGHRCGSVGCIAGWAVALTPRSAANGYWLSWDVAGRHALGLHMSLAVQLFRGELPLGAADVADVLRRLAKLPESERGLAGAKSVLTGEQYELLARDDDDE
jgi:hypothetical protein